MIRPGMARAMRACILVPAYAVGLAVHATPLAAESGPQEATLLLAGETVHQDLARKTWLLQGGLPVHAQLQTWAAQARWQLVWQPRVSWLVVADTSFEGNFPEVIEKVVTSLFREGKPVRLVLWEGNRVAEVVSNDIR